MDLLVRFLILYASFCVIFEPTHGDTYNVKIGTEHHVNVVDSKFLSFTVDPKYLFAGSDKYSSKESTCMATALSPSYIRIAGPSTAGLAFRNDTITFTHLDHYHHSRGGKKQQSTLAVSHSQWLRFIQWSRQNGFELVVALNGQERTAAGLWDPNAALSVLTLADQANASDIYWQLGYECHNQTIEEYLSDVQTLRVIAETFPTGAAGGWRVVGGDVTPCLRTRSSDFKDYVTLSEDMMDAVLLNGNSSAQELERMSEADRLKLLKLLSVSETPLWLTESAQHHAQLAQDLGGGEGTQKLVELRRAADWMSSLGYSAKNGFAVHFRELMEEELYEPTLSFYMALLFKNLVGERVLDVTMEVSQAVLFAHCTSLRRKPIPGAVTLYGANMDDEPARIAVKLSKKEEGGDVMQFILGHDTNGNIMVNGRAMFHEGDIRPVVKRVRPYKTLLLNLPPRSFGFWVLANTNIAACQEESHEQEFVEALPVTDEEIDDESNKVLSKRSMLSGKEKTDIASDVKQTLQEPLKTKDGRSINKARNLKDRIKAINTDLGKVNKFRKPKTAKDGENATKRVRRQLNDPENETESIKRRLRKQVLKPKIDRNRVTGDDDHPLDFIRKLIHQIPKLNGTKYLRHEKSKKNLRLSKNKINKRNLKHRNEKLSDVKTNEPVESFIDEDNVLRRRRRNILDEQQVKDRSVKHVKQIRKKLEEADSRENEINSAEQAKLWKILRRIHKQLEDLPANEDDSEDKENRIVMRKKLSDDSAAIKYKEHLNNGLVKSTIGNVMSVLKDLNKNLNKFWGVLSILE